MVLCKTIDNTKVTPNLEKGGSALELRERKKIAEYLFPSLFPVASDKSAMSKPGFNLHEGLSETASSLSYDGHVIHVKSANETFEVSHVFVATGVKYDLSAVEVLQSIYPKILLWREKFDLAWNDPADSEEGPSRAEEAILLWPYLGHNFEFQPRDEEDSWVTSVFYFNAASLLSCGLGGAAVPGLRWGCERLCDGITKQLYLEDLKHHHESLCLMFGEDCKRFNLPGI
jgi:hypothetical protein